MTPRGRSSGLWAAGRMRLRQRPWRKPAGKQLPEPLHHLGTLTGEAAQKHAVQTAACPTCRE